MVQGLCRLWNISVIAAVILTGFNILLTIKLMYSPICPNRILSDLPQPPPRQCDTKIIDLGAEILFSNLDLRLGRWDNKAMFKIFDRVLIGDKYANLIEDYTVCLATQSSIEKLHSLIEVTQHWTGPISAALFAAGDDEMNLLLLYTVYLRQCFTNIKERVTFHLVFSKERLPTNIDVDFSELKRFDCTRPDVTLQQLLKQRSISTTKWRIKHAYPQNHLRNLARKNCQTAYVFLTDIDIIPSINLAEQLDKFLKKAHCKGLCAYVIPTYEIDDRVRFPPNKTDLVRLAKRGLARPFHHKVFIYNQYATNFTRWENATKESPEVHISHPVTNFEFLYEPFYVAPDTVPQHDERFIGYGYTRNTQVYEMYVAGYEFLVLSPIFTCHWGLQVKRGRPAWREQQNSMNRKHFDTFKHEVFARYNKDPLNMLDKRRN